MNITTGGTWQLSQTAVLSVAYAPEIVVQPQCVLGGQQMMLASTKVSSLPRRSLTTVFAGATVRLSVNATGFPAPTYTWRFNDVALSAAVGSTSALTLTGVSTANTGTYLVNVCNSRGCIDSRAAVVRLFSAPSLLTDLPPSLRIPLGSPLSLAVSAAGLPFPAFQWYFQGRPLPDQALSSLYYGTTVASDEGNYTVVLTNDVASLTSSTTYVDIVLPPTIVAAPADTVVNVRDDVILSINVDGDAPFIFQWMVRGGLG